MIALISRSTSRFADVQWVYSYVVSRWRRIGADRMSDPVMCVVSLFFLAWVIYLKWQMGLLQRQMEDLSKTVKSKLRGVEHETELGR